jgi:hypothetical protein
MFNEIMISALILAGFCAFFYQNNTSYFVVKAVMVGNVICFISPYFLDEYYYAFKVIVEAALIWLGISMRANYRILMLFFISLVYNALSFLEFNTEYSFIYDNYEAVMYGLTGLLILFSFKNGVDYGNSDDHSSINNSNGGGYSRFFRRSLL